MRNLCDLRGILLKPRVFFPVFVVFYTVILLEMVKNNWCRGDSPHHFAHFLTDNIEI